MAGVLVGSEALYKGAYQRYPTERASSRGGAVHVQGSTELDFMPATSPTTSNSRALAQRAAQIAIDNKAQDVVLLDLRGVTDMTDFFVIASGTSDTHVRSIGQHMIEDMKNKEGSPAHHVEGLEKGRWVLLDFVDFVVHVFHPTLRNFYQLERLWADAEQIPLDSAPASA